MNYPKPRWIGDGKGPLPEAPREIITPKSDPAAPQPPYWDINTPDPSTTVPQDPRGGAR